MLEAENDSHDDGISHVDGSCVEPASPLRRKPVWYLREATRIARFDGEAIARVSGDRNALFYGAGLLAAGAMVTSLPGLVSSAGRGGNRAIVALALIVTPFLVGIVQLLWSMINVAVIHGAARLLFGAGGSYLAVLRVLWLGSVVLWLGIVPIVGPVVGGIWYLLITVVTFEEVDGVERLQALVLAIGFAAIMSLTMLSLL